MDKRQFHIIQIAINRWLSISLVNKTAYTIQIEVSYFTVSAFD